MRVLWFNLATDLDDPILGFTSGWIREAAALVRSIDVLTMRAGRVDLPENVRVHSVGKELGLGIPRRVIRFYAKLGDLLRRERVEACFSHMMPAFTVLGAPALRPRGIPIVTWYAHPSVTAELRLAHHVSDRMVTSLPSAYPYRRDKLSVIGQGIDTRLFSSDSTEAETPPLILCAGRLSPVKDHPTLLRAAALLRDRGETPFQVVILGSPARPSDDTYVASLRELVRELRLESIVRLQSGVPLEELPAWYRRSTLHVNLTPVGFGDKVALEAMACGRPSLSANEDFRETFGGFAGQLLFRPGDAGELSARLSSLLRLPHEARGTMGAFLRGQVDRLHSLRAQADRIVGLLQELLLDRRPRGPGEERFPK